MVLLWTELRKLERYDIDNILDIVLVWFCN